MKVDAAGGHPGVCLCAGLVSGGTITRDAFGCLYDATAQFVLDAGVTKTLVVIDGQDHDNGDHGHEDQFHRFLDGPLLDVSLHHA